jgi:lysophospholipase L1-like esterase
MIHVIGDSHVSIFHGFLGYTTHWIGGITAHNLKQKNNSSNSNQQLFKIIGELDSSDELMISAGEIDCRIHIYYQFKKNNEKYSISELISTTINNYIEVLNKINETGISFYVLGIPPPGTETNIYGYPYYAPIDISVLIYRIFNTKMQDECIKYNYRYLDIYSKTVGSDGFMMSEFNLDGVHLNTLTIPIIEKMINSNTD